MNGELPRAGDADDQDEDEHEDEDGDDRIESVRAKWCMDGATTLFEAAAKLREHADWLEELERDGWQLIEPVDDDWGHIWNPDPSKRLSEPVDLGPPTRPH